MKVAPIIHTRTYSCDFNSEFRVRPKEFLNSDVKWAREIVLEATSSIDTMQGERWVIADNGKYRLAGIVGFLKNICAHSELSDEQKTHAEELFCDDKGRLVYAFIGVIIPASDISNNVGLTYDYLWNIFVHYIQPVWKKAYTTEVITIDFESYESDNIINKPELDKKQIGSRIMYETNPVTDYQLFCYYLCKSNQRNFKFCSNLTDINFVNKCSFTIITTTLNIITRLERINIPKQMHDAPLDEDAVKSNIKEMALEHEKSKKKDMILLGSCVMICFIIFVIMVIMFL